jgi:hypothetical protein
MRLYANNTVAFDNYVHIVAVTIRLAVKEFSCVNDITTRRLTCLVTECNRNRLGNAAHYRNLLEHIGRHVHNAFRIARPARAFRQLVGQPAGSGKQIAICAYRDRPEHTVHRKCEFAAIRRPVGPVLSAGGECPLIDRRHVAVAFIGGRNEQEFADTLPIAG